MIFQSIFAVLLVAVKAQQVGYLQKEVHPQLSWKKCKAPGACSSVSGKVVLDAEWRWLRKVDSYHACYLGQSWLEDSCSSVEDCTTNCAVEGAESYERLYGVKTKNDSISQKFVTYHEFSSSINNRVFLLESDTRYQTFTLMNNEIAFDVDLSTVECGIASSLYFVEMDPDGGMSKFPTNKAGAAYGTGYCDASCPRSNKFIAGKANYDYWQPDEYSSTTGRGHYGACCSEFAVWNSNAHSFSMASKLCKKDGYHKCVDNSCDPEVNGYPIQGLDCDSYGCDYNPYRLGVPDFYGKGKTLDTKKKFTVVTQFQQTGVTQFYIQDGKKIEAPAPAYPGLSGTSGLSEDYCDKKSDVFGERNSFLEKGGWAHHNQVLQRPMVLAMAITGDYWTWNLWLDSAWPGGVDPTIPGVARGDCPNTDREPSTTEARWPGATVVWSNIRFGPIGSTVVV